ncbi:hypothetical protein GPX89_35975 [Nocardia sp. ET3-3]|uniref:Uncharacterized protein n=1 Tax=Nocardia terrae TaxID=2675851 RepID=A0A7K1V929_9NOCA|nr:hypothetical protein [Nocardia terrae]MVU82618.1 hypothetical protein [Nocardia terrae]
MVDDEASLRAGSGLPTDLKTILMRLDVAMADLGARIDVAAALELPAGSQHYPAREPLSLFIR